MGGKQTKPLIKKLDERDVVKLKGVYTDLAVPSGGKGIDMDTFKQFSQFSDMIAERAFILFSTKKPGLIDLEEFQSGLALCHRGSEKEKLKVVYRILAVTTDKISKDEVATVLNAAVSSSNWNTSTREDLKPPTELVQKLIEMGFPRNQCDRAVEETKATNVEDAVAWIVANKPDPLSDAIILLASIFEGSTDNFTNWKKFKKWGTTGKRPPQFAGFMNAFPMLYDRAILWSNSSPRTVAPKENLIDFTIEDIKPSAPTPVAVHHTGGRKDREKEKEKEKEQKEKDTHKRRSHRSLSQLVNRKSVDSSQSNITPPPISFGNDSFLSSDIPLTPNLPSLVPIPLHAIAETSTTSAPNTPDMPRLPSYPVSGSNPPTPLNSAPSTPTLSSTSSSSSIAPIPPSTAASLNLNAPPSPQQRIRAHSSLGHVTKKVVSTTTTANDSDDDWSSDEDGHELKPAIQVFIKPIGESTTASVPALAPPTIPTITTAPKSGRPSTVGARSRTRTTTKMALQSSFFDPQWTDAAKVRNSLADGDDSAPSTPTTATPNTSSPSTPTREPINIISEPTATVEPTTTENPQVKRISQEEPQLVKFASQANLDANPSTKQNNKVATEHMKVAMGYLEKGNFAESLKEVNKSLHSIMEAEDAQSVRGEANFCVAYKVALIILITIRELEGKLATNPTNSQEILVRMGFLSKILSDIPLKTNHRIVCVRMAISKNMHPQVANYGVAARLVEALLLKGAPDREALQTKLKKCKEDEKDTNFPPYECPHCNTSCPSSALKCSCGRPVRWCFKTFELIPTQHYLQCSFCNSQVSLSTGVEAGSKCEFCEHGIFEER